MSHFSLEIIAFNIESCITAQKAGAQRIELCDNPGDGGTTPSYGFIKLAREKLSIKLFPMIRPRGGDFFYDDDEFEIMKDDILLCKQLGCDGIVTGILLPDGQVDIKRNKELVQLAYPMEATFHRAFDRTADPFKAMEDVITAGFQRILTSGQMKTAVEGVELLQKLIEKGQDRIIIMPGSGVRSNNISMIAEKTGAEEFHSQAATTMGSRMKYVSEKMNEELKYIVADEAEVNAMLSALKLHFSATV